MKLRTLELPPPGAGLTTRKLAVVAAVRSEAGMATRRCIESTNVVVRLALFHVTTEPGTKFDPVIVTHVFPVCAVRLLGAAEEIVGVGFDVVERGSTNGPCNRTTRPLPLPQKSTAVRNARPSAPQRVRSNASPSRPPAMHYSGPLFFTLTVKEVFTPVEDVVGAVAATAMSAVWAE